MHINERDVSEILLKPIKVTNSTRKVTLSQLT